MSSRKVRYTVASETRESGESGASIPSLRSDPNRISFSWLDGRLSSGSERNVFGYGLDTTRWEIDGGGGGDLGGGGGRLEWRFGGHRFREMLGHFLLKKFFDISFTQSFSIDLK